MTTIQPATTVIRKWNAAAGRCVAVKANALAVSTVPIANIAKTMNIAAHAKNATTKVTAVTMTVTAIRVIATTVTVVVAAPATKSFVCLMINETEREQCESVPALSHIVLACQA